MTTTAGGAADRGTTTVELVLVAPALLAVLLLVVGLGRVVEAEGLVQGAARDAARTASLARTDAGAASDARAAATADLQDAGLTCARFRVVVQSGDFRPGGAVGVAVQCTAELSGLTFAGFPGSKTLSGAARAPLEQFRGIG